MPELFPSAGRRLSASGWGDPLPYKKEPGGAVTVHSWDLLGLVARF